MEQNPSIKSDEMGIKLEENFQRNGRMVQEHGTEIRMILWVKYLSSNSFEESPAIN